MTATAARNGNQQQKREGTDLEELINKPRAEFDRELAMLRMENETIMTECRMHPRDFSSIKVQLAALLRDFPEFADDAIYHKPVGREEGSNQQKYASGLSIRAAEALAEAYGYNRVRADVTPIDDARVKVEAAFTDFQTGRIWQDGGLVSRFYTKKGGGRVAHSDDRFYNVVLKAEKSKYLREVILRSVNSALKAWFEAECMKVAESRLDDSAIRKIVSKFAAMQVTQEQLEAAVDQPIAMGWTNQHRLALLGIYNAIKDGETTVAEAFTVAEPEKAKPTGPVKASDLTAPKPAESADRPQSTPEPDPEILGYARMAFGAMTDTAGVDFELDGLPKKFPAMTEATRAAVEGLARDRKAAIADAEKPKGKTQKNLA